MEDFSNSDFDAMLSKMKQSKEGSNGQSLYWRPNGEGTFPIRIISPMKKFGEETFFEHHKVHFVNKVPYLCLEQELVDKNGNLHERESCPFCQKSKQLYRVSERGDEGWRLAGEYRAKDRYVSRVIVRGKKDASGKDTEAYPEFWEFGSKIYDYFYNLIDTKQVGNFLSLKDGRDYMLTRKGSGKETDYSASNLSFTTSPVFTDKEKIITLSQALDEMPYSKLVEFVTREEMERVIKENESPFSTEASPAPAMTTPTEAAMSQAGVPGFDDSSLNPSSTTDGVEESLDDLLAQIGN